MKESILQRSAGKSLTVRRNGKYKDPKKRRMLVCSQNRKEAGVGHIEWEEMRNQEKEKDPAPLHTSANPGAYLPLWAKPWSQTDPCS